MNYWRGRICRAAGLGLAGGVVGQREAKHDGEPEKAGDDHKLRAPGAVFAVHEEENDERHFDGGDGQSENDVPATEVDFSGLDGQIRAKKKRAENCGVKLWGNDVVLRIFRHANFSTQARWRLIRYNNGNRKIQTISTKCQ